MSSNVRAPIREYVVSHLLQDRPDFVVTDTTDLLTTHIIDSLGIFTLVTYLEDQFGIQIDADEVVTDHFATVATIADLIDAKLDARAAARFA